MFDIIIKNSLAEDAPNGDITSLSTIPNGTQTKGKFIAKDDGVICGLEIAKRTFELAGGNFTFTSYVNEGDCIKKG
ncbi:nicotinate-nucleotide diphosphorylase (carboxylating), partial [Eubacteriales bacterium OttesenSCG-928-G02]|nr:nicotinate-nucleotide diphosphorylase (carboxylating) [Eubacteriales bacterium OttesenSCG-928-G02]